MDEALLMKFNLNASIDFISGYNRLNELKKTVIT